MEPQRWQRKSLHLDFFKVEFMHEISQWLVLSMFKMLLSSIYLFNWTVPIAAPNFKYVQIRNFIDLIGFFTKRFILFLNSRKLSLRTCWSFKLMIKFWRQSTKRSAWSVRTTSTTLPEKWLFSLSTFAVWTKNNQNQFNLFDLLFTSISELDLTDQSRSFAALPDLSLHITDLRGFEREEVNLGELLKVQVRLSDEG